MIKWRDEIQVIYTPWGRMTRNLADVVADYDGKRRQRFGEVVRMDEDARCDRCGRAIVAGTVAVYFSVAGRLVCPECAGQER